VSWGIPCHAAAELVVTADGKAAGVEGAPVTDATLPVDVANVVDGVLMPERDAVARREVFSAGDGPACEGVGGGHGGHGVTPSRMPRRG